MCNLCAIYVQFMCNLCAIYVQFMCNLCAFLMCNLCAIFYVQFFMCNLCAIYVQCMCNFAKIFSEKDVDIFILGPITLTYMTKQLLFSNTLFCGGIPNFLPFLHHVTAHL